MATETPLWQKVYMGRWGQVYIDAGRIIGHLGCSATAFFEAAKLLPGYEKFRFENAVRDLCVYAKREKGEYELHAAARKVLRVVLGPPPDDANYDSWWRARLISVQEMKEQGQSVEWAEVPPVPLEPLEEKPKAKRSPAAKKVKKK